MPLSRQAIQLLDVLHRITGRDADALLFPNDRDADKRMSENAVLALIKRIGYASKQTGHGFRSQFSSWAAEHGFSADAVEMQLSHRPYDAVRAAYQRSRLLPERARMMQAWADWIEVQERQAATESTRKRKRRV